MKTFSSVLAPQFQGFKPKCSKAFQGVFKSSLTCQDNVSFFSFPTKFPPFSDGEESAEAAAIRRAAPRPRLNRGGPSPLAGYLFEN